MSNKIKIVAVGGSLEKNSTAYTALKFAAAEMESLGARVKCYSVAELNLPLYNPTKARTQGGKKLNQFLNEVGAADCYIFSSPEYHGTISGSFKNVLDFFEFLSVNDPPYLSGKPVGAIATGGGENSALSTIQTLVNIIHSLRAISASGNVAISSSNLHIEKGEIKSKTAKRRLKRLAKEVYELAIKLNP